MVSHFQKERPLYILFSLNYVCISLEINTFTVHLNIKSSKFDFVYSVIT